MDCNFTTIKTCELKNSTFRSRILDFGDFDISDYTFSVVYKTGFDQVISEQELTAIGNILTVPLEAIEGTSNRAKAEVWMLRDGGFKDKVIVFDVVISATGCPSDASITEGVSVTFGGLKVPVEVNQGIVNISREVAFSTLSPDEKLELKGEKGDQGEMGDVGPQGPKGDPLTFPDLTTQQVNELKQPALDAAVIATTAAQNADTAAGLATDATVEAVNATGQAIAATAQAENAAENADEAAVEALAAKDAANTAAANNMARYNDTADTLAPDVIRRVDKATKIEQEYKQTTTNIDGIPMTDEMVDGFAYLKRGVQYFMNADFALKRKVYLDSYGLPGDGVFRKISELFPDVTLAQVQELNPLATLDNSADWYMLMHLNRYLPVNSTIVFTGKYIIDLEITWRRSYMTWTSEPYKFSDKYPANVKSYIRQIGAGQHGIAFRDADGITNHYTTRIQDVKIDGIDIIGTIDTDPSKLSGDGICIDIPNGDMIYCYFNHMILAQNGSYGLKHYSGHINEVYFTEFRCLTNFNCGMWLDGKPSSQCNLFKFVDCYFSGNGYVIDNGVFRRWTYAQDGAAEWLYKGGLSLGNITATDILSTATQENSSFGIMTRDNASVAGLTITGYGEMSPMGDYVMLAMLESTIFLNVSVMSEIAIYSDPANPVPLNTPLFSAFKSWEHLRKFVPSEGIKYLRTLEKRPWSDNLIQDAKTRDFEVVGGDFVKSSSFDEWGSRITTVEKQPGSITRINLITYEEVTRIPITLDVGDMLLISFDIKFSLITGNDITYFGFGDYGVAGYFERLLKAVSTSDDPTIDGEWKRISFVHEYDGTNPSINWAAPFVRMQGENPITFSIRNPQFKVKTKRDLFADTPNATALLKGVVNQAAAVTNVAATDATDLATALTLVNELKAKLNAKLGADRTAGQQAT